MDADGHEWLIAKLPIDHIMIETRRFCGLPIERDMGIIAFGHKVGGRAQLGGRWVFGLIHTHIIDDQPMRGAIRAALRKDQALQAFGMKGVD